MGKLSMWVQPMLLAGALLAAGAAQAQTAPAPSGDPQARTSGSPIGGIVVSSGHPRPKPTKLTVQTPAPTAKPTVQIAGKSHSEAAPQGPAPTKPKLRPAQKPGVKFGQ